MVECAVDAMNEVFGAKLNMDNLVVCFHDPYEDVRDYFMQEFGFEVEGSGEDGIAEAFCYGKDQSSLSIFIRMEHRGIEPLAFRLRT